MFIDAVTPAAMDVASPESVRNRNERFDHVAAISLSTANTLIRRFGGTRKEGMCRCVPAEEMMMAANMMIDASRPYLAKPTGLVWPVAWWASGTSKKVKVTR